MSKLIFITHPEVVVDPDRAVPDWGLNEIGRARAEAFALNPLLSEVTAIWSSTERKAIETARILSAPRGLSVATRADLGENDRSATGFMPREAFEAAADAFFAQPEESFRGWERAIDAQSRVATAVANIVRDHCVGSAAEGDLAIVAHGAVGTLLWCQLRGVPIDRQHDQPAQGHYWCARFADLRPETGWQSVA